MTSALRFPQELEDQVIDHMHKDKQALGTCGLVSKAWLRSSRHHLFSTVILRDNNWEEFLRLLGSSFASFTQSIQSLSITGAPSFASFTQSIQSLSITGDDGSETRGYFNELVARLQIFPALKQLRLSLVDWTIVSEATVDALGKFFGNITTLNLHLITFETQAQMADLVSHFPRLEEMLLSVEIMSLGDPPHWLPPPNSLRIVHLRRALGPILTWLQPPENPPTIHSLELGILPPAALPATRNLLRALGPQLSELDLTLQNSVTPGMSATFV
jgi:hypothetical protein